MTYFYGESNQEIYTDTNLKEAIHNILDHMVDDEYRIIVEMKVSRKNERFCMYEKDFIGNFQCGNWCNNYSPRNGKNGICKYQSWGLEKTGREWKVFLDGSYKKISGRKK